MYSYDDNSPDLGYGYSGGAAPSFFDSVMQPNAPNNRQMFLGGLKNRKQGQNPLLAGLSGFSGSGGFLGGLGKVAGFLI